MDYAISGVTRTGNKDPLTPEEAKAHLKPDGADDDGLITAMIAAVAEAVEDVQARVLKKGTLELWLADWPESGVIRIPRFPLVSVDAVEYLKAGADWTHVSGVELPGAHGPDATADRAEAGRALADGQPRGRATRSG